MKPITKTLLASATVLLGAQASAWARPLVILTTEGTTNPNLTGYTTDLQVSPGQTIYYEVLISLAPAGTSNSHVPNDGPMATQIPGTDGINSLNINLLDKDQIALDEATINGANGWLNAVGTGYYQAGTPGGKQGGAIAEDSYFLGQSPGIFSAADTNDISQILSGSFIAGSSSTDQLFATPNIGAGFLTLGGIKTLRTNGVNVINSITTTTESSIDPFVGVVPLQITTTPEPGALGLLTCAGIGLLARRRRLQS